MSAEDKIDLYKDDLILDNQIINSSNEGFFNSTFDKGLSILLESKKRFSKVKIFAYDAKNYIRQIERANVKIDTLMLLLKRVSDYQAWFMHDKKPIQKFKTQLEEILLAINKLKRNGNVKNICIRYYDFESYSHFGIFDDKLISGFLIPTLSINEAPVKIENVFVLLSKHMLISNYDSFFDKIFGDIDKLDGIAVTDSGLLLSEDECDMCEITKSARDSMIIEIDKCRLPLSDNEPNFQYITIRPDFHPISDIHYLVLCKYHMLSLYELIRHENSIAEIERLIFSMARIVKREYNRDILIFEHGSKMCKSMESGSSIDHLHVILKPENFDYLQSIYLDNSKLDEPIIRHTDRTYKFSSLRELNNNPLLKNKDYFLILDPLNIDSFEYKIFIMFPQKKESQYLRRIFYSALDRDEKIKLYGDKLSYAADDDYYDWEKYEKDIAYSDERLYEHRRLGKVIFDDYNIE